MNETEAVLPRFQPKDLKNDSSRLIWPLIALASVFVFNLLFTQGFFHVELKEGHLYGSLIDVFARSAPVMLLASGMTFVVATGGVDLSVGAVTAMSGAVAAMSLQSGAGVLPSLGAALAVATIAGIWNAVLIAWLEVQPIIATLVLMVAGRGIAQLLTEGQIIPIESASFHFIGRGFAAGVPFRILLAFAVVSFIGVLGRRTALGLFVESVGNSPVASRYAGIHSGAVKAFVYILSGLCAGIAGVVIASDIGAADVNSSGLNMELDAILAVVMGGTALKGGRFTLIGSVVGTLINQSVTTTIITRGVPVESTLVIKAIVILAICLLQSDPVRAQLSRTWNFSKKADA